MCGFAGILHLDGRPVDRDLLERMTEVLHHRGPDDAGYLLDGEVGLGFRRLSIIDLGGGHQPMGNEDGTVHVVFNGEIYNFKSLRSELTALGHVFRSVSDTEVIVHGYEAWGDEVVTRLNGMFAFAVWDRPRRRLLLARDRFGIKPLVYLSSGQTLAFASEPKSLLQMPDFDPAINDRAVFDYFSYLYIPDPRSIYRQVTKVQPGEVVIAEAGGIKAHRYWQPAVRLVEERRFEDWCEELRQHLREAVRLQSVADVPLGVFLSGGIDSSAIAAAMTQADLGTLQTFTVGFDVPQYDETPYAELVSRHLGTTNETFRLSAPATDLLPELLWYLDEPMADATILPTYLLSRFTRERVTVALSGEGGDELFAGYTHYQGLALNQHLQLLPRWLRRGLAGTAARVPRRGSASSGYWWHRVERVLDSSLFPPFEAYTRKVAIFTPEHLTRLFTPDFAARTRDYPHLEALWQVAHDARDLDPISQANLADLRVYLPGDLLTKADRMSMACSLEVRVPFLDHHLVDFALTIPMRFKLSGMTTKHVLREAARPWLPKDILARPKRGFNPPLEYWLQRKLPEYAAEHHMLETLSESGYINADYVRELIAAHRRAQADYSRQLWALLVFAIWWRRVRGRKDKPT
jgi:asparagine synthase (glutamine-hydrolysing)